MKRKPTKQKRKLTLVDIFCAGAPFQHQQSDWKLSERLALLGIVGILLSASCNPSDHHKFVLRGLRAALNCSHIMPRLQPVGQRMQLFPVRWLAFLTFCWTIVPRIVPRIVLTLFLTQLRIAWTNPQSTCFRKLYFNALQLVKYIQYMVIQTGVIYIC